MLPLVTGAVVASVVGVLAFALRQVGRPPAGNPASVIADGGPPDGDAVVVCLGDSITYGGLGSDWVSGLRARLGGGALVVNAGGNGEVAWSLRQRLDDVARCRPTAIVLLVGTNDAVGTLGNRWAAYYKRSQKLPQDPDKDWFAREHDALLIELSDMTPQLACLTLPPLGEQLDSPVNDVVRAYNTIVSGNAERYGADVLDLNATLSELLEQAPTTTGTPFVGTLPKFLKLMVGSAVRHHVLGQSWDRIAQRRGLVLTTDTIHPSDKAGDAIIDLVAQWHDQL